MFETKFSYTNEKFKTEFNIVDESFSTNFGSFINTGQSFPNYNGEYVLTPSRENKILETANKVMREDVTVVAIPFSQVSNLVGGTTFHIAKE